MARTLIHTVLWPGLHALEPTSQLGGIDANKPGYHNTRSRLRARGLWGDYSIRWPADLAGPSDASAGIDWTFPEAHMGGYGNIKKFSRRLLDAGRLKDPRTYALREFYGNADDDREVEGWDFVRKGPASSDPSHLWHIHISLRRKYVNDKKAIDAVLSILKGESYSEWFLRWNPKKAPALAKPAGPLKSIVRGVVTKAPSSITRPKFPKGAVFNPYLKSKPPAYKTVAAFQAKLKQRGYDIGDVDGKFGPQTHAAVVKFQKAKGLRVTGKIDQATFDRAWKP